MGVGGFDKIRLVIGGVVWCGVGWDDYWYVLQA